MRNVLLLSIFCGISIVNFGQTVSLVLSGGGAKGLAHVGVIKALEENGIPISNVSGTSMGAIVGGLYAMGYTPDEMVQLFKSADFNNWSNGRIDDALRYNINDFSQSDAENLSIGFAADKRGIKPKIISSYISTVGMDVAFEELCAQANALAGNNFDSLFVPFRCNASDIVEKKMVYFKQGNLSQAIRASMTFPMFFKPIYIDSVLMFDGGIYNNFLWREAVSEFNPDFIIGSKVASNSRLPSDEDPLLQLESMIVGATDFSIPDSIGFVVDIPFYDISLLDFDKVDAIVKAGYDAALKQIPYLKSRIPNITELSELNSRRSVFRSNLPKLQIKDITMSGLSVKQMRYIGRVVVGKNDTLDFNHLKKSYYRLMSDRVFVRLFPTLNYNKGNEAFDMTIDAKLKRSIDIGAGLSLSSDMGNEGFLSGNYSWLSRTSNTLYGNIYFGKLYSSARLLFINTLPSSMPISFITQVVANRMDYHKSNPIPFFEDTKPAFIIQSELFGGAGLRLSHSSAVNSAITVSYGEKVDEYYQVENYFSYDIPDKTRFIFVKGNFRLEKLTLNRKQFATRGRQQLLSLSVYSGTEKHSPGTTASTFAKSEQNHLFATAYLHNESYHRIFKRRFWMGFRFDAYWSNQNFFNNYHATILALNQFCPTPHSNALYFSNYRTNQYLAVGVMPVIDITRNIHFRLEAYLYQPYRVINADSDNKPFYGDEFANSWTIGSASLVYNSPIGPIAASAAYYPSNGGKEFYFSLSFGYSIFNPRVFDN